MQPIQEHAVVEFDAFHEQIAAQNQPAVIRGLVADWPAVIGTRSSPNDVCNYLNYLDIGQAVYTIAAPPDADGRFFYNDDLQSVNFNRGQIPLAQVLQQLLDNTDNPQAHAIAVQALDIRDALPAFEDDNEMPLLPPGVAPTMWIGSKGRVSPHYDVHKNLACVMAGRREFTLFPPEQIENLYLGPVLNAPGGVPISLVDVQNPDFDRFPRYASALESAQRATLAPGDAIFIPSLWWHAVASLETFNVLVNYWWGGDSGAGISANDTLLHAMLTIADLEAAQRKAWRSYFDYYIFGDSELRTEHLPNALQDISKSATDEQIRAVKDFLGKRLADDS